MVKGWKRAARGGDEEGEIVCAGCRGWISLRGWGQLLWRKIFEDEYRQEDMMPGLSVGMMSQLHYFLTLQAVLPCLVAGL